jgi:hypothetical protein
LKKCYLFFCAFEVEVTVNFQRLEALAKVIQESSSLSFTGPHEGLRWGITKCMTFNDYGGMCDSFPFQNAFVSVSDGG